MADEQRPAPPTLPGAADTFRRLQERGAQFASAAQTMVEEFTRNTSPSFAEPLLWFGPRLAETSMMWVAPMRDMLEQQQELVDTMAQWAEQQRQIADRFAAIAERQRAMTEQLQSLMRPGLDAMEDFRESVQSFASRSSREGGGSST